VALFARDQVLQPLRLVRRHGGVHRHVAQRRQAVQEPFGAGRRQGGGEPRPQAADHVLHGDAANGDLVLAGQQGVEFVTGRSWRG